MRLLLRSEEHTSELQSPCNLVCRLLLEKKKNRRNGRAVVGGGAAACRVGGRWPRRARPSCPPGGLAWSGAQVALCAVFVFFFFNDTATTEIYTLSLHDALPISRPAATWRSSPGRIMAPKSVPLRAVYFTARISPESRGMPRWHMRGFRG